MSERSFTASSRPGVSLAVVALLAVFGGIVAAVASGVAIPLDARLVDFFYELSSRHATLQRAELASALAGDARVLALVLAGVVAALLLARRTRHAAWVVSAAAVMALEPLLAEAIRRPLPFPGPGHAFPSGHALGTMTVAAVLVLLLPAGLPRAAFAALAAFGVLVVGVSVVGDGGHWPTDVVGAWSLALAWVIATREAFFFTRHATARRSGRVGVRAGTPTS